MYLQAVVNGLLMGGVYGLAALGLALIWGVMKVVNLAHGVFIMLGAYLAYWMFVWTGLNPFVTLLIAAPIGMVLGVVMYRFLLHRVMSAAESEVEMEMMTLLFTFACSIVIYGGALNVFGSDLRGIPQLLPSWSIAGLDVPASRLSAFGLALALGGGLTLFLRKTHLGRAIRAVSQSRDWSMVVGINPKRIFEFSFAVGLTYALMAGVIIALISPVTPFLGYFFMLKCFTVVVLGGLGNPIGSFLGGLILGLAESLTTLFASYAVSPAIAFILLIVILLVRPTGILGTMR